MTRSSSTQTPTSPLDAYTLAQLRSRTSVKWTQYSPDVLPLWVAEMDCATVPAVTEIVTQMLAAGDTGYPGTRVGSVVEARSSAPDYRLLPTYPLAYAQFARERWGWEVDPAQIRLMPDVMQGVQHAIRMLKISRLLISTPVYGPFRVFPAAVGASVHEAGLTPDMRLDFAELERRFPAVDGFLLSNPHNPAGVSHTPQELARVFELAREHDVRVIIDEIHAPLTSPQAAAALGRDPFTPALSVPGSERAVVLFSAAKGFNLAGFKAAVMIAGTDAISDLANIPDPVFESASTLSIAAHTAALVHGGQWLDQVRHAIDARRRQWIEGLADIAPAARVLPSDATYFGWTDFSQVEVSGRPLGADPSGFLFREARLAFNPGVSFGVGGEGFVRVNLATSHEIIDETLSRLNDALNRR